MTILDVTNYLEEIAPIALQESYDNCGLQTGNPLWKITGVLTTLDCTEAVVDEAIQKKCNLIIAHHPVIFKGVKKITGNNYVEKTLLKAIKNDVAIYAAHTNFDTVFNDGVNTKLAQLLALSNISVITPKEGQLCKLVVYCPTDYASNVRAALFAAGLGKIGNYDSCSFNTTGTGTFRALHGANPFVGEIGNIHNEKEERIEGVFNAYLKNKIINALKQAHPYEEVAYDLYELKNTSAYLGIGVMGTLPQALPVIDFLSYLKNKLSITQVRYTKPQNKFIYKVAVCGGSGSFLIKPALNAGIDALITSDVKYHEFFDAEQQLLIADIGHYETEKHTKELFFELLTKKFSKFAVHLSEVNTNPINYF